MTCERINKALTEAFKAHATFCRTGRPSSASKAIMTQLLGKAPAKLVYLEQEVESILCRMVQVNPVAADVIRLEYGAGWQNVMKRRPGHGLRNFQWNDSTLEQRAQIMKIEPTLYTAYLRSARNTILEALTK
ncbi:MAG: hypothetical protein ACRCUF_04360 [Aeromonas sobria]